MFYGLINRIWAQNLVTLSIVASLGLLFSTSAFATTKGAMPIAEVNTAKSIVNFATEHSVCSSTYISNSTYLAECKADVSELSSLVSAWTTKFDANTLTVAYDIEVEESIADYVSALKTVLQDAGYTYTPSVVTRPADESSGAYQIVPDISPIPDSTSACAVCWATFYGGAALCGLTIEAFPVALLCLAVDSGAFYSCANTDCSEPTEPPKACT